MILEPEKEKGWDLNLYFTRFIYISVNGKAL